jgi:peptide methionine sulfoxide reductase msrA/msrB
MKLRKFYLMFLAAFVLACGTSNSNAEKENTLLKKVSGKTEIATFAGGCFWCIEAPFEKYDGVLKAVSGYAGGEQISPSYKEVSSGKTGHVEAVQVHFDPQVISYSELLDIFWKQFDPTDGGGSFHDRGSQYTSAIFYHDDTQKSLALASKERLDRSGIFDKPVITPIKEFSSFYEAEDYHQNYYMKNPGRYNNYRNGSGRTAFIAGVWGSDSSFSENVPAKEELKTKLSDLQYHVTQKDATERAFANEYWDNKEEGIYVDIVSGEPLFSSRDKYKSGSGWPSFVKPIDPRFVKKKLDYNIGVARVEIRSKVADSHLGHVFYDGPEPTNLRYCVNSASMRFIAKKNMKSEGYESYLWLVE